MDAGALAVSRIAKCVLTADTTLTSDGYNIMVGVDQLGASAVDSEASVPCFIFPSGMMVEDIGFETSLPWDASVGIRFGDCGDSDGWASTVTFIASATMAAGEIKWMSKYQLNTTLESTVLVVSTTLVPAYLAWGPRVVFSASDDTGASTAIIGLDTDVLDIGMHRHRIHYYQDGAVAATGTTAVYLKYNFSHYLQPVPTSDLGVQD